MVSKGNIDDQDEKQFFAPDNFSIKVAGYPDFAFDIRRGELLERQMQQDPQAAVPLIQIYKRFAENLQIKKDSILYAWLQTKLGDAYFRLPTGDQTANLIRVIVYYQEALRIWTPEGNPLEYAHTQNNLGFAYWQLPIGDRTTNITKAMACYQEALRIWTPQTTPLNYALTKNSLGKAYLQLSIGDQSNNIVQAIGYFKEALGIWTLEDSPLDYALTENNLGQAYHMLPTGNKANNLIQAIGCYQEALRFWTPETAPAEYAGVQNNLGNAYLELPTGDRMGNLAKAVSCYQEALRFWTPETPLERASIQKNLNAAYRRIQALREISVPPDYMDDLLLVELLERQRQRDPQATIALIQVYERIVERFQPDINPRFYVSIRIRLGNAYCTLPTSDRETNVMRGIACYQEALRFLTPEEDSYGYAMVQHNLGNAYGKLLTGERAVNIERAIACYQEALRFRMPENAPFDYARTQNGLGTAYRERLVGDHGENLTRAITCYQEALRFLIPETDSFGYALTQANLGSAYCKLPVGDHGENLTRAITCYQEALRFLTPETALLDYANTMQDLGNAYQDLPTGDRADNLAHAITCYQEALRFLTPENAPFDYAMAQTNLGNAYQKLPTGDRNSNLAQAIICYQVALRIRTPEVDPMGYAHTQQELGNAYSDLRTGDRIDNQIQAISCFQNALRFRTPETDPLEYAKTQYNLGRVYCELLTGEREANLEKAITCCQEALRFLTTESAPLDYANAQINLGRAYQGLLTGEREVNLEKAITCYEEALHILTPETTPFEYAGIQLNLGGIYQDLPTGDRGGNLGHAIACYQEAFRFFTPETAPFECRLVNRNLAQLHFDQENWKAALDTYRIAMNVGELLYHAGLSTQSKAVEIADNAILYRRAAFSAVRCGQVAEALLILEQGKTRLLTDALHLRVPRPVNVPDEIWAAFEQAGVTVRSVQDGNTYEVTNQKRDLVQVYRAREQGARNADTALNTAIEGVRVYAPEFLRPIDLFTIQGLLSDEKMALVAFSITDQGSLGFVLSGDDPRGVQVIEAPTFTQNTLQHLILERLGEGEVFGGWLGVYATYRLEPTQANFKMWQVTITNTLKELGQHLLAPILSLLPSNVERIIFLPSSQLFLLPLHAAPLSENDTDRVCDRYQVSYAPSIEVLADARARVGQEVLPELYAVINPENDPQLVFTRAEGAALAQFFTQSQRTIDIGLAGTKQQVIEGMRERTYVHFSCHGSYNWDDPPASGLALADGRLTLADLQEGKVDLSAARLVTLSACETGVTDILRGSTEEYVGVPAGFLLAGAPCVVSSLWAVPDLSTALLMERFYRNHLKEGMAFAAALREAQMWVRDLGAEEVAAYAGKWYQQSPQQEAEKKELLRYMRHYRYLAKQDPTLHPFAHPHYWAAFTVNGW